MTQALSREDPKAETEEQRRRLHMAEAARIAQLAETSARAGEQVEHARHISALTKMIQVGGAGSVIDMMMGMKDRAGRQAEHLCSCCCNF